LSSPLARPSRPGRLDLRLFARLVLSQQGLGLIDIALLAALRSAAKQHDQRIAVFRQIDPVTGSPVDDALTYSSEPLDGGGVAQFQAQLGGRNLGGALWVEAIEPHSVRIRAVFAQVLFYPDRHAER
jgi:hypothetical protein